MGSKTPLMAMLRKAYRTAVLTNQRHTSDDSTEIFDAALDKHLTRRKFMRDVGRATIFLGASGLIQACQKDNEIILENQSAESIQALVSSTKKVAIIGAGIAGLSAAHTLSKAGFNNFTIFESSNRTGGRMFSASGVMGTGLITEYGGEFVDSNHTDMLQLASEFGLSLLDTQAASETALIKDKYFFNGQNRTLAQVVAAMQPFVAKIQIDIDAVDSNNGAAQQFDNMSISAYLTQLGMCGWIKELIEVAYDTEFGLDSAVQSTLNLLWLISADLGSGNFEIFGVSDERYKIAGGNQQVTDNLTAMYQAKIQTGKTLQTISKQGSKYYLTFSGSSVSQSFDQILVTIPFTKLREVGISANLPSWKTNAINNLGYGTNSKLFLGYNNRPWRTLGYSGYYFTDNGAQSGWDNTQLQGGTKGSMTVFSAGATGLAVGTGTVQSQANIYLPKVNQIFAGSSAQYNNKAARFIWPTYSHALGSYPCYLVGQGTTISGNEGKRVGQMFFAGDHCSDAYQGYMNGGAETGRTAATEMLGFL
jgi:monoamine oxidase